MRSGASIAFTSLKTGDDRGLQARGIQEWYEQLWRYSVELFRSLDIPVRQLECCSGDLADLKCKSCDIEAWSPRQQKYFEVCSCSNLGDAQARRLKIRYKDETAGCSCATP